ncbi:MAG: XdhC family protein [Chromatiales bacterium]|jgi:xanthine dehydrogenase accessory factor
MSIKLQADDVEVLDTALNWLQSGEEIALVTVVKTWGSSPRPPGSLMVMNRSGQYTGSVSGGCVEEELLSRYREGTLAGPSPTLIDFGVDSQEASRFGLPCGGRLEVLTEFLNNAASIQQLLGQLQQGQLVTRKLDIASGKAKLLPGQAGIEFQHSESSISKTFGPSWQLLLVGDGQIAGHLARMALQLDYRVIICDPRDTYQPGDAISDAHYSKQMPDDAVSQLTDKQRTAVVVLAHDPRQDDLALSAALESEVFYIGALGSRRSAEARHKRLESLGYSEPQLARIHGPAGLHIGSKRPAEIAVSILAQITAIRNGING